jgi:DNA (cytosine-5)-methyltransferase 1
MIKVLNLYAGIGGNRKLWENVEVTAIENNPQIAKIYSEFFPNDKIIITDAHEYLLKHYSEYDFIWSSPPCPTHSRTNNYLNVQGIIRYPDMKLWQEIIFLKHFYKGKWVIENVISYYEPLIKPFECGRHYFWSNFHIHKEQAMKCDFNLSNAKTSTRQDLKKYSKSLEEFHEISLTNFKLSATTKRLLLRNCVYPPLGKYVFDCAFRIKQTKLNEVIQ